MFLGQCFVHKVEQGQNQVTKRTGIRLNGVLPSDSMRPWTIGNSFFTVKSNFTETQPSRETSLTLTQWIMSSEETFVGDVEVKKWLGLLDIPYDSSFCRREDERTLRWRTKSFVKIPFVFLGHETFIPVYPLYYKWRETECETKQWNTVKHSVCQKLDTQDFLSGSLSPVVCYRDPDLKREMDENTYFKLAACRYG